MADVNVFGVLTKMGANLFNVATLILFFVVVVGGVIIIISRKPEFLMQFPYNVYIWAVKGNDLILKGKKKGRYNKNQAGLLYFKVKGIDHTPIPEISEEFIDAKGNYNLLQIDKKTFVPIKFSVETATSIIPVFKETEIVEDGKKQKVIKPTGKYTSIQIPHKTIVPSILDNVWLMIENTQRELKANDEVIRKKGILERNKELVSLIVAGAFIFLMITVTLNILGPMMTKAIDATMASAKIMAENKDAIINLTKAIKGGTPP